MGVSLLATSAEHAVYLAFIFYLLILLVPVAPVAIIYRLFPVAKPKSDAAQATSKADQAKEPHAALEPSSTSSIKGKIGGWEIAAAGTWGSYVTALVLGFFVINNTAAPLITKVGGASIWTIDADFTFKDDKGNDMVGVMVPSLDIDPPRVRPSVKHATIRQWSETGDPPDEITVKMDGYQPAVIQLGKIKPINGRFILSAPVTLQHVPYKPPSQTLTVAAEGPTPVPTATAPVN